MISSNPDFYDDIGITERSWLEHAGITFEEYHVINYRLEKEIARSLIQNASVVFLLGGNVIRQNRFLKENDLSDCIKESNAIVIGASAGAINMSAKWFCSKTWDSQWKKPQFTKVSA